MKKLLLALFILTTSTQATDIKVSALPAVTNSGLQSTDLYLISRPSPAQSYSLTQSQLDLRYFNLSTVEAPYTFLSVGASSSTPSWNLLSLNALPIIATATVIGNSSGSSSAPSALPTTGTGNVVESASPTLTGTVNGAAALWSGNDTAAIFQSNTSSTATVGLMRLASGDTLDWRNNANSGNVALGHDASDNLTYNGNILFSSGGAVPVAAISNLTNTQLSGSAAVSNANLAQMASHTFKGNNGASSSTPADLTAAQATALLATFTSSSQGAVPASGGGTTNFLRADGNFATPPGAGTVTSVAMTVPTFLSVSGSPISSAGTLGVTLSGTALPFPNGGRPTVAAQNSGANTTITDNSAPVTILTKSITAIAGDTIELRGAFAILNNSGSTRTYTATVAWGTLTLTTTFAVAASATNLSTVTFDVFIGVNSTSSTRIGATLIRGNDAADGSASNIDSTVNTEGFASTTGNLVGTQTASLQIFSSATTTTQTLKTVGYIVNQYNNL